jgi:hypothetical protein
MNSITRIQTGPGFVQLIPSIRRLRRIKFPPLASIFSAEQAPNKDFATNVKFLYVNMKCLALTDLMLKLLMGH